MIDLPHSDERAHRGSQGFVRRKDVIWAKVDILVVKTTALSERARPQPFRQQTSIVGFQLNGAPAELGRKPKLSARKYRVRTVVVGAAEPLLPMLVGYPMVVNSRVSERPRRRYF